jgi:ubiquinone/menaquinone biosynthesis C-methylase UbiE
MQRVLEPEAMDTAEEADDYASMDHREANAAFLERLFELGARGRMLDIGTGPGQIPLLVCARDPNARVTGVDLSEHMLRHARAARDASPFADRLDYRRGDAKALEFGDASFDAVYSNTILHHIPEPTPFLREAHRVLRPGGALLIRDLFRPATAECVEELVSRHAGDATPAQRALFRDSLHAALTPEELRRAADAAGLEQAQLVVDTDRHVSLQLRAATRAD